MTAFAYEIATVLQAQERARPGDPEGSYALPWYLVIGEPGSGRTTAIKALNLSWPQGDAPVALSLPEQLCDYWVPASAVFVEPGPRVLGSGRDPGKLHELMRELRLKRPREPVDGVILLVSAELLADASEAGVGSYATALRRYLIEVAQALAADTPVYVVVTHIDALWGFGDAFRWGADRVDEEPWGFSLPLDQPAAQATAATSQQVEALAARIESTCFARLATDDPAAVRTRAFQHLLEMRALLAKLVELMAVITGANAFERAPWVRALALGSGTPGTGNVLRCATTLSTQLGIMLPPQSGTAQPGGMPLHAMLDNVLLPERDIVPTRVRWRDDKLILALFIAAMVASVAALVFAFAW